MASGKSQLELVITARATQAVEALEKVHGGIDRLARKINATGRLGDFLNNAFRGVAMGAGFAAFLQIENVVSRLTRAIPDLINKGVEWGEVVDDLSDLTGASAKEASTMLGVFQLLGISMDNVGTRVKTVAAAVASDSALLRQLGVDTKDADGKTADLLTIMDRVRHQMSLMPDGAEKTALQFKVFGKAAGEFTEYLTKGDAAIEMLRRKVADLGLVIDEQGVVKAEALSRTMNLLGASVQGLANRVLNDVEPVIEGFVTSIATWIEKHSADIAQFIGNALNWIVGFANALFGLDIPLVGFGTALENLAGSGTKAAGGIEKTTDATKAGTDAVQKQVAALQAKDKVGELAYSREKARLDAVLQSQLDLLDAAERARAEAKSQLDLEQQLSDAQAQLAKAKVGGDPSAVASAADRVRGIYDQMREAGLKADEEGRRQQIKGVQDYLSDLDKLVSESVNRQALAKNLATRQSSLEGQVAAAKAAGDEQKAADLTTMLEGVKAASKRVGQKSASDAAIDALSRQRGAVVDLNRDAGTTLDLFGKIDVKMEQAFKDAKKAGEDFAETLKVKVGELGKALGGVHDLLVGEDGKGGIVGGISSLGSALASISLSSGATKAIGLAIAGFGATRLNFGLVAAGLLLAGISWEDSSEGGEGGAVGAGAGLSLAGIAAKLSGIPGVGPLLAPILAVLGAELGTAGQRVGSGERDPRALLRPWIGRAQGGPVVPFGRYVVGENGPETLVMGSSGGYVSSLGGSAGQSVVVHTAINLDGQRVADVVDRHLFNSSRLWQGVSGGSLY